MIMLYAAFAARVRICHCCVVFVKLFYLNAEKAIVDERWGLGYCGVGKLKALDGVLRYGRCTEGSNRAY